MDVSVHSIITGATDANPVKKGGAASVRFLRPRYRTLGGQTTSREFSVWCESQTSDLAFFCTDRAERSIGFGSAARCHERGIAQED